MRSVLAVLCEQLKIALLQMLNLFEIVHDLVASYRSF